MPGARGRPHHLDLPAGVAAHQPVHQLPGGALLPPRRPRQRAQALLLQPVAPAHAAAAGAHLQEARQGAGWGRPGVGQSRAQLTLTGRPRFEHMLRGRVDVALEGMTNPLAHTQAWVVLYELRVCQCRSGIVLGKKNGSSTEHRMVETPELHQVVIISMYVRGCVCVYTVVYLLLWFPTAPSLCCILPVCSMTEAFKPKDSTNGTHCIM